MPGDFLALKGFLDLFVVSGSGETESAPDGNRPATLVSRGSSVAYPRRKRPHITFQSAPFEVRRVGNRNGRAVVPRLDATFHLRN